MRTPIRRYGGALASVRADDLAAIPTRALIAHNARVTSASVDDVVLGCANQSASVAEPFIKEGTLRPLAVAGTRRLASLPGTPAIAETLASADIGGWFMVMAPAGTPPEIVQEMSQKIAEVLQLPDGREVAEPLLTHRLVLRAEVAMEVESLLVRVGIPDPAKRAAQYPHELSGGLRQRALIASALAGRPRLLIADEPTTALDVTIQQQVLGVFSALARAGHAILLITHDLAVAAQFADRIAVIQNGEFVETGATRQVLGQASHSYTQRLLAAVPAVARRDRWLSSPGLRPAKAQIAGQSQEPVLTMSDIFVRFTGRDGSETQAVAGVSLAIRQGETLGVVGESGSGKTTLGKVALALRRPDSGEVLFRGQPWSSLPERARRPLRRHIQTIVQDPLSSLDPRYTVGRLIEQPLRLHTDLGKAARQARVEELVRLVNLPPDILTRRPTTLSGGQRQRVSIAQALACEPELLICDEPVSALDVTTQAQVFDLLVELQHRLGLAMLFVSHDLGVVHHLSDRVLVMSQGVAVETGEADDVLLRPSHPYTKRLVGAVPQLNVTATGISLSSAAG